MSCIFNGPKETDEHYGLRQKKGGKRSYEKLGAHCITRIINQSA